VNRELRLPEPDGEWGYAVTSTLLPGPGCFVFEVAGRRVHDRIVFKAIVR
jgi:hypothetical protein